MLLPSSCGRKRYNVLGAYDPIRQEAVTLTNETVVNQVTFCALLDKIVAMSARDSPLHWYWTMPVTKNAGLFLIEPKNWGLNSCICQPIPPI